MGAPNVWLRAAMMAVAVAMTLVAFVFWGALKNAVGNFLSSAPPPPRDKGEVTIQIIPSKPQPPPKPKPPKQ
ncbi:MAG: hypothetical protein KGR48_12060 [Alphaproteobacteria bacterium]|nr:hypothetical protein [Alphaproteobacteria bacterium]MBU6471485.1 hypothetical protein [Alphaproteobacteria bacterium]MDE2014149.1 hypothetical protein [Alphaproteobacteria bacterium]MDE2073710.1 hypothetical protein [Alphaproteobacteria bacterium]MDE2352519.1 hypothetical protein [Alphaproteobacteria bacterium]